METLRDIKIPIEPHPYTLEEAEEMLRRENPLVFNALEEEKYCIKQKD